MWTKDRKQGNRGIRAASVIERLEGRTLLSVALVADINTSAIGASSAPDGLVNLNGSLLFRTTSGTGTGLFRSDGTATGTQRLTTTLVYGNLVPAGRQAFFFSGTDLWATDGTVAGTRLVKSIGVTSYEMVAVGGAVYFVDNSNTSANGAMRLWRSDGTAAGTVVIKTTPERNESPRRHELTRVGNSLYFVASAGTPSSRFDIYKSDGTAAGTTLFKSVLSNDRPSNFFASGDRLYLNSGDSPTFVSTRSLWTDGVTINSVTDAGGTPLRASSFLGTIGNSVYFYQFGEAVWKTDGTAAGTVRVGTYFAPVNGQSQAVVGETLFLAGSNSSNTGVELMKADATGVSLVKDLIPGTTSSNPRELTAFDGRLYFTGNNGSNGNELWRSDGTPDGTVMDTDIFAGLSTSSPEDLIDLGGTLFFSAEHPTYGRELFKVTTPLSAPLGLRAVPSGNERLTLTWGNPGTSATGFKVERSSDGVTFAEVAALTGTTASTYTDTGLMPSTAYYYRVRLTTPGGDTPYSGSAVATTAAGIPAAPVAVSAAAVPGSSTSVSLAWVDNSSNEDGFRVYRSTDPSPTRTYTLVGSRPAAAVSYEDAGLAPGTTYYYVVAAYNGIGESRSTPVSVTTRLAQAPYPGPAAMTLPGVVQAEHFDIGGPTIAYADLSSGNDGGAFRTGDGVDVYATSDLGGGFRVESAAGEWMEYTLDAGASGGTFPLELRAATAGPGGRLRLDVDGTTVVSSFDLVATGSATSFRTFQLGAVTMSPGTHVIRLSVDGNPAGQGGVGLNWMRFSASGLAAPSPAPSNLVAAALSRTQVSLAWAQLSTSEAAFSIERRLASSPTGWGVVGLADVDATAYDDPTIAPNTAYVYRLSAVNAGGPSAYSNEAAVTTPDAPAVLVKDLNTRSPDSNPRSFVGMGGRTFFIDDDGSSLDGQLWVSDGTTAGTIRLTTDMKPTQPTRVGNLVYFTNDSRGASSFDSELWKSDGTVAGTVLVKDIFPGPFNSSIPDRMTDVGGTLYFSAVDASGAGRELWKSDGTAAGTVMVRDVNPTGSSNPSNLIGVNGKVVFTAEDGTTGTSLWVSDGTAAGTQLISDLWPGPDSLPIDLMTGAGALAYFRSNTGELWRTDGTVAGSFKVSTTHPSQLLVAGTDAYFSVGTELWKSDGTIAGTSMLNDAASTGPTGFATDGTSVYYFAIVAGEQGFRLWRSDGTAAGTGPVTGAGLQPWTYQAAPTGLMHAGGGRLFFSADDGTNGLELWTSDGTAAGTHQVAEVGYVNEGSRPQGMTSIGGGVVLFAASSPDPGRELWRSDGTAAGTTLVKDIRGLPTEYSNPNTFTTVGNQTYFWANYSELWKTDGTEAGTRRISAIGAVGGINTWPSPLVNVDGTVYFYAYGAGAGAELFKTDGTAAGTVRVTDLIPGPADSFFKSMTAINGKLYFGGPGQGGSEYGLWRTDGTPQGTELLQNFGAEYQSVYNITGVGSSIFFSTQHKKPNGLVDYALWKTDGTVGGAAPVRTFDTSFPGPYQFTPVGNTLYFQAGDGSGTTKLWRSDGTAAGTTIVYGGYAEFLTRIGTSLYFVGGGSELWKSDGTPAGTVRLHAFDPMTANQFTVRDLTVVGDQLLFLGQESATGRELWRSDGTAAGTNRVADLVPGTGSSNPDMFRDGGNGNVYFRAFGSAVGLWHSDGTPEGTQFIANPTSLQGSISADNLAAAPNSDLLFTADDGVRGRELWRAYGAPPAPVGQATVGGGAEVSLTWALGGGGGGGGSLTLPAVGSPVRRPAASLAASTITGYAIERRVGTAGAWTQIAIAAADAIGYVDRSAVPGTTYAYRIRAAGPGGTSYSAAIAATVVAPAPVLQSTVVGDASAQRSQVTSLTLAFDRLVTLVAGALKLELLNAGGSGTDNGAIPTDASAALATPTSSDGGRTWVYTFLAGTFAQSTGGSLVDGIYAATVDATKVTASGVSMAENASFTFHRLFGDVQGSKNVSSADYFAFRNSFGKVSTDPTYVAAFDFDGSGAVNSSDYFQFRNRFGKTFNY